MPAVIVMIGVNGSGKTTTTAKLARALQQDGKSVLVAACDTFRAAAVEQLKAWAERLNLDVVASHTGADAAAVAYDALQAGKSRGKDVVIIDTAGRVEKFRQKFGGKAAAKATGDGAVKTAEKRAAAAEAKKTDKPAAKKVATKKAK
jgi:flagellar biosynthesis GTPase FlhF